jgi:glycosyltransferase involved in cell wall biosynthesis
MKNKRILYLITQSKYGGAQRYTLDLAYFSSLSNTVLVAVGCPEEQDESFFRAAEEKKLQTKVLPRLQRNIHPWKNLLSIGDIYGALRDFGPDILHINSSMAGFTGSVAAWLYTMSHRHRPVRVVYTAHGFVFNEPLPLLQKKFYLWLEKISAYFKNCIISVSDFDKISAVKHKVAPAKKIITIHNGITADDYAFLDQASARQKLHLPQDAVIIGTIASHYPTKGLPYLIGAAALLPDLHLAIIGDGPERGHLEQLIHDQGLTNRVTLLGALPQAAQYLRAFDLFVSSSVKEGLAYAILEAGLTRLPVVVTDAGGNAEIVTDMTTGRVVPIKSSPALASAITETLTLPDHGASRGHALYTVVTDEFSARRMHERTEHLYDQLLD